MEKKEVLEYFVAKRPEALGAYGYGSGVFKQTGYDEGAKPQIDVIFLVKDLRAWHLENMRKNKDDYSISGMAFVILSNIKKLKGNNRITFYSQISEGGYQFKYGVMEEEDFLSFLDSWENFFIAGRFHKPVLTIKGTEEQKEAIEKNKKQAFLVASLLSTSRISKFDFYKMLCNLSYSGTLRMYVAENPRKIDNIVSGNFDRLGDMYNFNEDYISETEDGYYRIDHLKALKHIKELPSALLLYLYTNNYDFTNIFSVRKGIFAYLREHNKQEELHQSFDGIKTNGIVRSTPYLFEKVKKRVVGR